MRKVLSSTVAIVVESLESRSLFASTITPGDAPVDSSEITLEGKTIAAVPGEWVITLREPIRETTSRVTANEGFDTVEFIDRPLADSEIENALGAVDAPISSAAYLGTPSTLLLKFDKSIAADRVFHALQRQDGILSIEPNRIGTLAATTNDPDSNVLSKQLEWLSKINAYGAWDSTVGSSGVVVAVIDNGVYASHEDLTGQIVDQKDFTTTPTGTSAFPNPLPSGGVWDEYSETHGTSVAGIIAGIGDNSKGIAGVAMKSRIMALKSGYNLNSSGQSIEEIRYSAAVGALNYVAARYDAGVNVRVVNASWLFQDDDVASSLSSTNSALFQALDSLNDRGIIVAAAAGNAGDNLEAYALGDRYYPISYANDNWFQLPNLIGIGMVYEDVALERASNSNYGPSTVDMFAPGRSKNGGTHGIWSTRWRSQASAHSTDYGDEVVKGAGGPVQIQGTSFATPMVVGTIALILSQNPEASITQIRDALMNSASIDYNSVLDQVSVTGGSLNVKKATDRSKAQFANFSMSVLGDLNGSPTNDSIVVSVTGSNTVQVRVNNVLQSALVNDVVTTDFVNNSSVAPIAIFGLGGNDSVTIQGNVSTRLYISGGFGADNLNGGGAKDTLVGGSSGDTLSGNGGNDLLLGGNQDDQLFGGSGDDSIDGGSGNDSLDGGTGFDTLAGSSGNDTVQGGADNDIANYTTSTAFVSINIDGIANDADGLGTTDNVALDIETLWGSAYGDALIGSSDAEYFDGGSGNDSIFGAGGNDTLFGYLGVDSLNGGDGDDELRSNESPATKDQTLRGGIGIDTLFYDSKDDDAPSIWESIDDWQLV